jgi:hypothetical protein
MPDEEQIFAAALSRSSEDERASYLAQACGGDADLRAHVESLLMAYDRGGGAGGLLETRPPRFGFEDDDGDPANPQYEHWVTRHSADGGTTWQTVDDFQLSGNENEPMAVADLNGTVYVAGNAGSNYSVGVVRSTTDGGATWNPDDQNPCSGPTSAYAAATIDPMSGTPYAGGASADNDWLIRSGPAPATLAVAPAATFSSVSISGSGSGSVNKSDQYDDNSLFELLSPSTDVLA